MTANVDDVETSHMRTYLAAPTLPSPAIMFICLIFSILALGAVLCFVYIYIYVRKQVDINSGQEETTGDSIIF